MLAQSCTVLLFYNDTFDKELLRICASVPPKRAKPQTRDHSTTDPDTLDVAMHVPHFCNISLSPHKKT